MTKISPALLGFIRAIGVAVIIAVLTYIGNADNLPFLSPSVASVVAALVLSLEHAFEAKTGKALLGAAREKKTY